MTDASIDGPKLKLDRAKKHLTDLESACDRFLDSNPYTIIAKDNPEAEQRQHRLVRAEKPPDCLSLIAGDAVHNLRSALDHLIWQLVIANGGKPDELKTEFPIWRSKSRFESGRPGNAKGISKDALEILYGLEPHKGGNNSLWLLRQLDVVDKHRLLIAVGAARQAVLIDMIGRFKKTWQDKPGKEWVREIPDGPPVAIDPLDREIMTEGVVVFETPLGDDDFDGQVDFTVEIALDEAEIPEGEPLIKTLHELTSFVDEVIDLFAPLVV